jgi:hypothetical protein
MEHANQMAKMELVVLMPTISQIILNGREHSEFRMEKLRQIIEANF